MINGRCFTNEDNDKLISWPDCFVAVPRIGERVSSRDRKHSRVVCGIEYGIDKDRYRTDIPIVIIELKR